MTMMTFMAEDPRKAGIVELDAKGIVVGFHEKSATPPGQLANAAVFMLEPEVLEFVAATRKADSSEFSVDVISPLYPPDSDVSQWHLSSRYRFASKLPSGADRVSDRDDGKGDR